MRAMATFRISQAADLVGVSDDTIRRHIALGHLDVQSDFASRKIVDGVDLARFIQDHTNPAPDPSAIRSSARNRFVGLVTSVVTDTVMSQVEVQCGPHRVVSLISSEAVRELGLKPGMLAVTSVKSTDVLIETPKIRSALPPQLKHHAPAPAT